MKAVSDTDFFQVLHLRLKDIQPVSATPPGGLVGC